MRGPLEYWVVVAVRGVARRLPDGIVRAWGSLIGLTFYALDREHRRVALANLEQCFPKRPARERRAIARATFSHFGQVLLRLLTFSALSPEQMLARAEYDEGVRLAYSRGKGVLFFTGHFGFWELQAIAHGVKLRPIGVLARTLDNPPLNDLLESMRTRTGNSVIYRQGAVRRVGLAGTKLAVATCGTIRLKLLKLGARVTITVRRVKLAFASSCPDAAVFVMAARRLCG